MKDTTFLSDGARLIVSEVGPSDRPIHVFLWSLEHDAASGLDLEPVETHMELTLEQADCLAATLVARIERYKAAFPNDRLVQALG